MASLRVFVIHSEEDISFTRRLIEALLQFGADVDVWYDEGKLAEGSDQWAELIQRELLSRSIYIVVLSKASIRDPWVREETSLALVTAINDKTRVVLPVLAEKLTTKEISEVSPFLASRQMITFEDFDIGVERMLEALGIRAERTRDAPETKSPVQLVDLGNAAQARGQYVEALSAYEQVLQTDESSFDALYGTAVALAQLTRYDEALGAFERALAIDAKNAGAWFQMGSTLLSMRRDEEALTAYGRALDLEEPQVASALDEPPATRSAKTNLYVTICYSKGAVLRRLGRYQDAIQAYEQALALDPQIHMRMNPHMRHTVRANY